MSTTKTDHSIGRKQRINEAQLSRRGFLGAGATLTVGTIAGCAHSVTAAGTTEVGEPSSGGSPAPAAATPEPRREVAMLGVLALASTDPGGGEKLRTLPERESSNGRLDVTLVATMRAMSIGADEVNLRSYGLDPEHGPYGPTLRIKAHNSRTRHLTIDIDNRLPREDPQCPNHHEPNVFNDTNVHTHGLHVSPREDDIFRRVKPTYFSRYTYVLDAHPGGTHWYHPHVHGSTGMQVASGMSGFLIVEGAVEQLPAVQQMREQLLLFNQIIYKKAGEQPPYELPDFAFLSDRNAQPPQGVTINGQVRPVIEMRSGEVQRWRLLNSGFRNAMRFRVDPMLVQMHRFAVDGINFDRPIRTPDVAMGPGNRMDLFVRAPNNRGPDPIDIPIVPHTYNALFEYRGFLDAAGQRALAQLERGGDGSTASTPLATIRVLPESAPRVEIPSRLPLHPLWRTIEDRELLPTHRNIEFDVQGRRFLINGKPFETYEIPHQLKLGTAERWNLSNTRGQHPFHIHVNPFQVTHIGGYVLTRPMWKDTIVVPGRQADPPIEPTAIIRSRYTQHTGDFVLHCHILHHEDLGMMHRVRIDP